MHMRTQISQERLKEFLHYDPETGIFTHARSTNKTPAGSIAGSSQSGGYRRQKIEGRPYLAHRLAWLYVNGSWPQGEIDHINGIRSDNRIANLRDVSHTANAENRRNADPRNKAGKLGVSTIKCGSGTRYVGVIDVEGRRKYLGCFKTAEKAHGRYLEAKRQFHGACTI